MLKIKIARYAISILAILLMSLTGCLYSEVPSDSDSNQPSYTPYEEPEPTSDPIPTPLPEPVDNTPVPNLPVTDGQRPPDDRTWISPGKVNVANYYPGGRAEYPIIIHNGKDTTCDYLVSYRYPDHVEANYVKPPVEAQDWIIIADATPVLMPRETKDILVVLAMPKDAESPAQGWEFWISVMDATQTGMVKTELCSRWLISMR